MVIIVTNNRTIELVSEKKLCLSLVWLICGLASCVFVSFAHAESIKDWRSRALRLQAHLDYHAPLVEATFAATHNSYLADVYYPESIPEFYYIEPIMNHNKSVKDQLEAGARMISFDVYGLAGRPKLCHKSCDVFGRDRSLKTGLQELNAWLNNNPNEVVFLFLEDGLTNNNTRNKMTENFEDTVLDKIYRSNHGSCDVLPLREISKQNILDAGKQFVVAYAADTSGAGEDGLGGNCGKKNVSNQWKEYVWKIKMSGRAQPGDKDTNKHQDFIDSYCSYDRPRPYDFWIVPTENRGFGSVATAGYQNKILDSEEVADLVDKCNVAAIGLDYFISKDRRTQLIWSWDQFEPDNYAGNENCAVASFDLSQRWIDSQCDTHEYPYACFSSDSNQWRMTQASGIWDPVKAELACKGEFGYDFSFAAPINAGQNAQLYHDASAGYRVWLNLSDGNQEGTWTSTDSGSIALGAILNSVL